MRRTWPRLAGSTPPEGSVVAVDGYVTRGVWQTAPRCRNRRGEGNADPPGDIGDMQQRHRHSALNGVGQLVHGVGADHDARRAGIGLQRTAANSIRQEFGSSAGGSGAFGQFARLSFPIGIGFGPFWW